MECFVLCIKGSPLNIKNKLLEFLNTNHTFGEDKQHTSRELDYDYEFIDLPDPTLQSFVEKAHLL